MNIPLGDTNSVKWVDGGSTYDLDYLVLNGVTIWEKVIEFTASSTYNPITKKVTYEISGDRVSEFDKWSYTATRTDNTSTGEIMVESGTSSLSGTLGVAQDGDWSVEFKGYIGGNVRGTQTSTVTVATPFIDITSVTYSEPIVSEVQVSQLFGYTTHWLQSSGSLGSAGQGVDFQNFALLVKATCSTLGLDNDYLGMTFTIQNDKDRHVYYTLDQDGMKLESAKPSWGDNMGYSRGTTNQYGCVYIRLLKYTGEGWYNKCADTTQDHDTSVLNYHLKAAENHTENQNSCVTAWAPFGSTDPAGYFIGIQSGSPATNFSKSCSVGRHLGLSTGIWGTRNMDSGYGSRASIDPRIGPLHSSGRLLAPTTNYMAWDTLFNGGFKVNNYIEFGTDPAHRSGWSYANHIDINAGWNDTIPGKKGTQYRPMTLFGQTINGVNYTTYYPNQGWTQVHKFSDNPPQ